jgi:Leucine-rich repeat (LRR) protein
MPQSMHLFFAQSRAKTMGSDHLDPIIEVNCSYRGLTELPLDLPPKTKIIRLEGNEIEDLKLLKQDPIYRKALDLYLDNNKVKSIEELEGSYWLRHFRVFSLSGNRLTEVIIVRSLKLVMCNCCLLDPHVCAR